MITSALITSPVLRVTVVFSTSKSTMALSVRILTRSPGTRRAWARRVDCRSPRWTWYLSHPDPNQILCPLSVLGECRLTNDRTLAWFRSWLDLAFDLSLGRTKSFHDLPLRRAWGHRLLSRAVPGSVCHWGQLLQSLVISGRKKEVGLWYLSIPLQFL